MTSVGPPVAICDTTIDVIIGTFVVARTEKVKLFPNTADGKTVTTVVAILRVDIAGIEDEDASDDCRARRTGPVVAVRADTAQRAIAVIVLARILKSERRAT